MHILSFGEVLWDVYPEQKYIGGAPLNFAAHFVKNGGKASMLSAVGNDNLGLETIEVIKQWGVGCDYISIHQHKQTGKCLVTLNEKMIPSYNLLSDVAYDEICMPLSTDEFDVFYFGTLALRSDYNFNALSHLLSNHSFKEVFVDVNIRPPHYSKRSIELALNHATMIKISDEELPTILKEIEWKETHNELELCRLLCEAYPQLKVVIITKGDKGSFVYDKTTNKDYAIDAKKVEVVSTVGAGDSFSATFLAYYLRNESIDTCLEMATKVSAFVVSKKDAIPEYTIEDIK